MSTPSLSLTSPGPLLMLSSSLFLCSGAFYFDWSETHVLNPRWPPHARFHNGQTMTSSLLYLVLQGYLLSRSGSPSGKGSMGLMAARQEDLWIAALVGSLYTVSALSGGFYPGALYMDPEFGKPTDRPQMWMFLGALVVNWIGYFVGRGSLG